MGLTTLGVLASMAQPAQAAAPAARVAVAKSAVVKPADVVGATQRPDVVSAGIQAAAIKAPVQVSGATTESSTTWALADGRFRVDSTPGPVRVQQADGSWVDNDLSLVAGKEGWVPAASPRPVTFSAGGSGPLATFTRAGRTLKLQWGESVPAPTVTGASAAYAISADEDLVLEATADGFEESLVIKKRPAIGAPAPVLSLPLILEGLKGDPGKAPVGDKPGRTVTFDATAGGGSLLTATGLKPVTAGQAVFAVQQAQMFSAAKDPSSGEHSQRMALTPKLASAPTTGLAAGADTAVTLTADKAFLDDPGTVYPVTIDPTITAVSPYGDTYVDSSTTGHATSYWSSSQISTGAFGGYLRGAMISFDRNAAYMAQHVTSASLQLYNTYSGSCTASALPIYPLTADFDSTTTWDTWSGAWRTDYSASKTFAHGFSGSCPAASESIDVTSIVSAWAFGDATNYGFFLAADPSDATQAKSFCSFDLGAAPCNVAAHEPTLSVTYNSYPWDPQQVGVSPQVAGTNGTTYVTSLTPSLQAKIGNSDGTVVGVNGEVDHDPAHTAEGTGEVWSDHGQAVTPLSLASVTVSSGLVNGDHYEYRVRGVVDNPLGTQDFGDWSPWKTFTVDTSPPTAPTVSCTTYAVNTWTTAVASSTCTIDTTSTDGSGYWWGLDNPTPDTLITDSTNTGAAKTVTITPAEGYHTLYARSRDVALQGSATTTAYTFGVGKGGILSPKADAETQQSIGLNEQSTSAYTTFKYQYLAGTTGTWTDVPVANVYPVGSSTHITVWPTGTVSGSVTNYPQLNWNVAATLTAASKPDGAVQVHIVFNPAGTIWTTAATTFTLAKTAFAGSAAQTDLGPGTVSLVTGDFAVDATDANFGGISIGRTNTNLSPPAATTGPSGVFGAGWSSASFGPEAGEGAETLNDNSAAGSVTLVDASGTKATYTGTSGGTFTGIGDADDGSKLLKSGSTWTLTDTDATITTFTLLSGTTYTVSQVQETGTEGLSTYTRDGSGRVTQITAPPPATVSCTTLVKGCRAVKITYATSTTATGTTEATWGNYTGLVSTISYDTWDPSTSAMLAVPVADYLYDNTGHLRAEWDPRISPALKTRYTYDATGRLATETDPGRATWTMAYDSTGRLSSVTRPDPTNGNATQALAYAIALSGTNLPDVSAATAATWNQTTDQAYAGAAVFPASHIPATGGAGTYAPTSTDWPYANLTFYDVNGRPVNTADYGAGAWQIASTRYDAFANEIWSLSARNRAQALTPTSDTDPYTAWQHSSAQRADLLASTSTYSADGVDLLSTLSPAHPLFLAGGVWASVRVKTTNTYDQGAPTGGPYHLLTRTDVSSVPVDGTAASAGDTVTTLTGYDPIDGASSTGATSGWIQRAPTTVTTVMGTSPGSADIVHQTRYDSSGRTVETRMPESVGTGAGTTITVYYTADTSASVPACRDKPEWAGLLCQSGPQAQPPGTTVPVTTTTYTKWDAVNTVTETSGTSTRVITTGYDSAARPTTAAVTVTPTADGGTPVPTVTTGYDPTTGDVTTVTNGTTTISAGYNSIGEQTSYTDADGQPTSSTYTIDGQSKTLNDGKGTYTYTYDGTDANGKSEHRGLVTGLDVGISGSPSTFTAGYDEDGNLSTQIYPNTIRQRLTYDNTDDQRTMTYDKSGTTWMSFGNGIDGSGRTLWQASPGSYQSFGYDNNDRLIYVGDEAGGQCTTRQYAYSKNGNRTGLTTGAPAADGSCQTSTTTTKSTSYDTADRDTNTGYAYDKFGRTTTAPSADVTGAANLSIGYYANDMVATQTQGTASKTFTLDPEMRLRQATDTTSGTETRRILNHYNDSGDTPSWINTSTNGGSTWTWERNITGIDGNLAILQDPTGNAPPQVQLTNPHGDIIATADDTTTVTSTNAYFEQTEYGTPRTTNTTNPARYGWLGGKQRSNDDSAGLICMGVRLYNPATGRFLSADPVVGGNENPYVYPGNPINRFDLDGRLSYPHRYKRYLCHGWNKYACKFAHRSDSASLGYSLAAYAETAGATCGRRYGMTVCWNSPRWLYSRIGTTLGDVYFTGSPKTITRRRMKHEKVHRQQWRDFGSFFAVLYAEAGSNACTNFFEQQAGLKDGGYNC